MISTGFSGEVQKLYSTSISKDTTRCVLFLAQISHRFLYPKEIRRHIHFFNYKMPYQLNMHVIRRGRTWEMDRLSQLGMRKTDGSHDYFYGANWRFGTSRFLRRPGLITEKLKKFIFRSSEKQSFYPLFLFIFLFFFS